MNIGEFNLKHKNTKFVIKYDGDKNRYTLERPSEEYRTSIIFFEWGVNSIRAIDGGNQVPHEIFDDFISVYQLTKIADALVPLEIFTVNNEEKYRFHNEETVKQIFTEYGFNDIYLEEEVAIGICYVRVYLTQIYNEDKLRVHLKSQFDHEINRPHIMHWEIYNGPDLYRPFVSFYYKCEW